MVARTVTVTGALGLHARAAARFVRLASRYAARVQVERNAHTIDGKSILGLLLLAAAPGTTLTVSADGPDETPAIEALCRLVENAFSEEP